MTDFMDADHSKDYLNKYASKIATIINDNSPYAMDFLREKLDQWLSLPDRASIFPITDNDFGEPVDNEITFDQACVMISAIHDKHCPRSEKIGQYTDKLVDDSGKLLPDIKKSITYHALLANVPETLSLDDTEVLEYHSKIIEKRLVSINPNPKDSKKHSLQITEEMTVAKIAILIDLFKQLRNNIKSQPPELDEQLWDKCETDAIERYKNDIQKQQNHFINRPTARPYSKQKNITVRMVEFAAEYCLASLSPDERLKFAFLYPEEFKEAKEFVAKNKQDFMDSYLKYKHEYQSTKLPPVNEQELASIQCTIARYAYWDYVKKDTRFSEFYRKRNIAIKDIIKKIHAHMFLVRDMLLTIPDVKKTLLSADFQAISERFTADEICHLEADGHITACIDVLDILKTAYNIDTVTNTDITEDCDNILTLRNLNDTEQIIIEALGKDRFIGEQLAIEAGYSFNSNFKQTLSSMTKREILQNKRPGYILNPQFYYLLDELRQSQDKGQDRHN